MKELLRKLLPGIILGFLALVVLAMVGDLRQVVEIFRRFNWWIFPLALLFTLFNYCLRYIKFMYYLRLAGGKNISRGHGLRLFVAGFPLAVSPGKVGEVLKGVWITQCSDIPLGKAVSIVLAERISDGLAVLFLSTVGVILYPQYWPAFLLVFCGLVGLVVITQIRPAAIWLLDLCAKLPLIKKAINPLRDFYEGSYALFKPLPVLTAVGLGIVSWFGEGIGFYFILTGLGLAPDLKLFSLAVFVLSFSTVVGAVSTLPGGLGAAEASIAGMLTLLGGIPAATSTSATVLIRLATLWFGVLLGVMVWFFSLDLLGLRPKNGKVD